MTFVKGKGHIWPEYWIDCCRCDHHAPLATRRLPAREARKQGWRRVLASDGELGNWVCPHCIEEANEIRDIQANQQFVPGSQK